MIIHKGNDMALTKCKECGSQISSSASVCPHCGKKKPAIGCNVLLITLAILIIVPSALAYCNLSANKQKTIPQVALAKRIEYEVIRKSSIPNGGYYKTIVISPQNSNEEDMIALGETLKFDHKDDRNAFINVFNDKESALKLTAEKMSEYAMNLKDHTGDKYYKHFIGKYEKNGNTGHHKYYLTLDGFLSDNSKEINYTR